MPHPGGRPSKLSPEVQERICNAIRAGNYYRAACRYGGIDYSNFRDWMLKGQRARSGVPFDAALGGIERLFLLTELEPAIDQRQVGLAAGIRIRGKHEVQTIRRLREIALRDVSPGRLQVRVMRIRAVLGQDRQQ